MDKYGQCAIRGQCGSKTRFGQNLPCPYDGPAIEPEDDQARALLVDVCGEQFLNGPACCTSEQVESLRDNFEMVDALLLSCPACRNNFRSFFCSFTCSPDQGTYLNVTSTQLSYDHRVAVKSLDFYVGRTYADGFYESCKEVKLSAANDYAMTFIGGGAKNFTAFLKFLGDTKEPGSPFQIDMQYTNPRDFVPYDPVPRRCSDSDLQSRCACMDCPSVCPVLQPVSPGSDRACYVGGVSCLTFILTNIYALIVFASIFVYFLRLALRKRKDRKSDRIMLPGEDPTDNPLSPRSNTRSLLGASSLVPVNVEDLAGNHFREAGNLGRGASLIDPIETLQPRHYRLNTVLRRFFYRLGLLCATYPWFTFTLIFTVMGILNLGWKNFEIETDPVRLWVAPNSETKLQKEFFDEHFGPFYKTEQIFITTAPVSVSNSSQMDLTTHDLELAPKSAPVLTYEHLRWWFSVEAEIRSLVSMNGTRLTDICLKPSGPKTPCVIQSLMSWFDEGLDKFTWRDRIVQCAGSPADCLPDFKQPLAPQYIMGGLTKRPAEAEPSDWLAAHALIVTIVIEDSLDAEKQSRIIDWEKTLREFLQRLAVTAPNEAGLNISFSTGVSLEEEINKSTNTDVKIVVLSYLMMFIYVAMTLGNTGISPNDTTLFLVIGWICALPANLKKRLYPSSVRNDTYSRHSSTVDVSRRIFVNSKVSLGLFGISLVILSVSSSVGLFSAAHVKVTLIIAEVIPFLVLAVGVDNVFILVHELDRQNMLHGPNAPLSHQNGFLGTNTTSTATASASAPLRSSPFSSTHEGSISAGSAHQSLSPEERVARTLAKMGPSILLSSLTEVTAFVLGALVPMPAVRNFALYAAGSVLLNAFLQSTVFVSALALDLRRIEANRVDCFPFIRLPLRIALPDVQLPASAFGGLTDFMRRVYAPFLLKPVTKGVVLLTFGGLFVGSIISIQSIELGLDQRLALPRDSYLVDYFDSLDRYFDVGPPVYFVVRDVNISTRLGQQQVCGRFTTCSDFSVVNVLEAERKRPELSFLSQPANSWIDDFLHWLNPATGCCRVRRKDPDVFCEARDSVRLCKPCLEGHDPVWNITMDGLPEGDEFERYVKRWLLSPADEDCALGGRAAYSTSVFFDSQNDISASHFRTSHVPLKSQSDYINSLSAAKRIANAISEKTEADVFPYSIHYVFFDQYLHIISITQELLGFGLASILVITALLLGSWRSGLIVTGVVASTVTSVMGMMGLWGITLNAISLVNLVISLGIAVEFCAHVARAFMGAGIGLALDRSSAQRERDDRVWAALVDVGPSVLSGITFTKLIGISVLAMTRSKLLEIYYFRMWFTLIFSGALHGLILLPVMLSYAGGPGYALEDVDEEWMSTTVRRRDYEYTPFIADDDSVHSD